ncbi:hypothetical protein N8J89_27350 [Crossiella sp. CA-258035]|uniref:hypothetical protein n=1 Tax=Crossiella sp. CA-258035 TaxID=2981138 RepID=UPI0024BC4803|nr:hypothetical protein [Crossiella sp. CA-258035]WHT16837.1 hypothetical protein N8J89_27350 [Crossiella sp. CA-258035]
MAALRLLERLIALAHGFAALDTGGFLTGFRLAEEEVATRATQAAAALIRSGQSRDGP